MILNNYIKHVGHFNFSQPMLCHGYIHNVITWYFKVSFKCKHSLVKVPLLNNTGTNRGTLDQRVLPMVLKWC